MTTNQQGAALQKSRAEQETEDEANRLTAQVEAALALVSERSLGDADSLDSATDRVERAARDLVMALRELAHERKSSLE